MRVPGASITAISWEYTGHRIALTSDSNVYFANVKNHIPWAFIEPNIICVAKGKPGREDKILTFVNVNNSARTSRSLKNLRSFTSYSDKLLLVLASADNPKKYVCVACLVFNSSVRIIKFAIAKEMSFLLSLVSVNSDITPWTSHMQSARILKSCRSGTIQRIATIWQWPSWRVRRHFFFLWFNYFRYRKEERRVFFTSCWRSRSWKAMGYTRQDEFKVQKVCLNLDYIYLFRQLESWSYLPCYRFKPSTGVGEAIRRDWYHSIPVSPIRRKVVYDCNECSESGFEYGWYAHCCHWRKMCRSYLQIEIACGRRGGILGYQRTPDFWKGRMLGSEMVILLCASLRFIPAGRLKNQRHSLQWKRASWIPTKIIILKINMRESDVCLRSSI